jgi:hypothetical protein
MKNNKCFCGAAFQPSRKFSKMMYYTTETMTGKPEV